MNVLFVTNYFGLHGSTISLLSLSSDLKKQGHNVFFIGGDGQLMRQFQDIAKYMVVMKNRNYLPSMKKVALIQRFVKKYDVDVIIGIGKFIALECQLTSVFLKRIQPITMMNFSPRRFHWQEHPQWHVPKVGFLTVTCLFYKDLSVNLYQWLTQNIYLLSARYAIPDTMVREDISINERKTVLFIRRLDSPKYSLILKSLEQLSRWNIWRSWSIKIVGGGTHEDIVKKKIDEIKNHFPEADIVWLGPRKNIMELLAKSDIVIGSERVVVEGMIQGCLALLACDNGLIDLITPENIEKYSYDNFFGYNYSPLAPITIKHKLFSVLSDVGQIYRVIRGNYEYVKAHFDVRFGSNVLADLIRQSTERLLSPREVISGVWKIFVSWVTIYFYLIKDRMNPYAGGSRGD